jgi:hypothetical protein
MGRLFLIAGFLLAGALAFAQSDSVPDYIGFYGLHIPGFQWQEGAAVSVHYKRVTGTLNLDHTTRPVFEADGLAPISLSLDQASRLLFSVDTKQPFDLIGLEGTATGGDGTTRPFFVVFLADVNGKQINLIPSFSSSKGPAPRAAGPAAPAPDGPQGPPGPDNPGGGVTANPSFEQSY